MISAFWRDLSIDIFCVVGRLWHFGIVDHTGPDIPDAWCWLRPFLVDGRQLLVLHRTAVTSLPCLVYELSFWAAICETSRNRDFGNF